ncbi:MAG: hypothetical protein JSW71_06230 [Gemmatimonadota bacterium]|nr:MAG: hypothetical protein JSW71_06230 [Gemmatimonadota bacterium]
MRPVLVSVFGDIALYHYWTTWTELDDNGVTTTYSRKEVGVWHRVNGERTFLGGIASPDGG